MLEANHEEPAPTGRAALGETRRQALVDGLVLVTLVVVSAWPYVGRLGFYSDDWAFVGAFSQSPHQSLAALFRLMHEETPARPVQWIYLAALYKLFGTQPLGYHVVNHAVIGITAVTFYLCLRRLTVPRVLSLAWPLVFVVLPHYATTRLWYAVFQANLSLCFYFVGVHAALTARASSTRSAAWRIASAAALGASVMAYEVVAPLFVLIPLLEEWVGRRVSRPRDRLRATVISAVVVMAVLGASFAYKSAVSNRVVVDNSDYGQYVRWLLSSALSTNLVELGWRLPVKAAAVLRDHADRVNVTATLSIGVVAFVGLLHAARTSSVAALTRSTWLAMSAGGAILLVLGYATFLLTSHVGFSVTGMNNRTAIAGAIGVALTFVGVWGAAVSLLPSQVRHGAYALGIALLCVACSLVTTTVATFWAEAAVEQRRLVAQLRSDVPSLPPRSVLLLDGVCPYRGPGTVFETDWDVTWVLRLSYEDSTLVGDVVRPTSTIGPDAVTAGIYEAATRYPYGARLLVYDVDRRTLERLPDGEAARRYFEASRRTSRPSCVPGVEGSGAAIF